jgi:hypothetical protein
MDVNAKEHETIGSAPRVYLPLQAAPINRTMAASTLSGNGSVQPSVTGEEIEAGLAGAAIGLALGLLGF